jgi:hypothetical protein
VPCPSEWPFCLNDEEDDWHILFGCNESRQVWIEAGMGEIIDRRLILCKMFYLIYAGMNH